MRDISRMSLISAMTARRRLAVPCPQQRRWVAAIPPSASRLRLFSSALSGVRISCDTIATKRDIDLGGGFGQRVGLRAGRSSLRGAR